jgi:PAS domain S-box-containing protein
MGVLALAGWLLGIDVLKSVWPGWVSMKINTALCFIVAGLSLGLRRSEPSPVEVGTAWLNRAATVCAALVVAVGLLSLSEYLFGWNLGLDELVLRDDYQPVYTFSPGRMSLITAVNFLIMGLALLLPRRRSMGILAQALTLIATWISLLTLVGYLYDAPEFFVFNFSTSMALHTVLCFLVLCLGVMCAWPDQGFMVPLTNESVGGVLARRLLPAAVLVPIGLGWAVFLGVRANLLSPPRLGIALVAVTSVAVLTLLIWLNARVLDANDIKRKAAEDELRKHRDNLKELVQQRTAQLEEQNAQLTFEISERKLAALALAESEERYRLLFDSSPDAVLMTEPSGSIQRANPEACRMFGHSEEEILRLGRSGIMDVNDPRLAQLVGRRDINGAVRGECTGLRKNGLPFPIELSSRIYTDAKGQTVACIFMHDITKRKQDEEQISRLAEWFQLLLDFASDGVHVHDLDGHVVESSESFRKMLGYSRDEMAALAVADWDAQFSKEELRLSFRKQARQPMVFETVHRRRDGSLFPVEISSCCVELEGKHFIYASARDITERKRAEDEKRVLEGQLRHAQKMQAVGTLAGGVAHEFNNLLGMVMGFAELARDLGRQGEANTEEVEQIIQAADRASALVRQMLTFSRKAGGDKKPMSLNSSVIHAASMLQRTLPKAISVDTRLAANLPPVEGDGAQLEQVLINLATNARDAMPEGGKLTISTELVGMPETVCSVCGSVFAGEHVLLTVSDTGQGMDPRTMEHMYEPFFSTKEVGKGTGLGLSVALGLVQDHGGHINSESSLGAGTTFRVYLPALQERPIIATAMERPPLGLSPGGAETVLLVDDEEALRSLGGRYLSAAGYQVVEAGSGEEALEIYRARDGGIDLVVLDLGMPGMGGQRCLQEIIAGHPKAKVVIASGYTNDAQVKGSLAVGAMAFVAKPYKRADLLNTVRNALDRP